VRDALSWNNSAVNTATFPRLPKGFVRQVQNLSTCSTLTPLFLTSQKLLGSFSIRFGEGVTSTTESNERFA
jgi:hypothetical protein